MIVAFAVSGCGDDGPSPTPLFPADYPASYVEVRGCRPSTDHDLMKVIVLADPAAADAYSLRDRPFATGAVILKEEYGIGDDTCSGPVEQWTVMVQLPSGSSPATLDWAWQKVDRDRNVVPEDERRCISCHTNCGGPPDGYLGTCAPP